MLDVTLEELTNVLGVPTRTTGHQHYFRCPACSAGGGDTSGDNLLFNDRKGVLKCFACDDGAKEALRMVNSKRQQSNYTPTAAKVEKKEYTPWWQKNIENLLIYMCEAEDEMTDKAAAWLWRTCGIDKQTIKDCAIGYDAQPNMIRMGASVTFPMFSLNHDGTLVGFELRQVGDKKFIKHTLDAPSCLCIINDYKDAENLVICEGFKDAYCFRQFLRMQGVLDKFTVLTPAHGVSDIYENLKSINYTRYNQCYLLLDNDLAGDEHTQKILQTYPFFKDKRELIKPFGDVAEWWIKNYVEIGE